jgi:hypothetical protein
MQMYISITTIQEMLTAILQPVMIKAKKESEFIASIGADMEETNKTMESHRKKMKNLETGFK